MTSFPIATIPAFALTYFSKLIKDLPAMKIFIAIAFLLIIGSLASALFFVMRDKGQGKRTVKALALRVGFSITLFLIILVMYYFGLIQPTGIRY